MSATTTATATAMLFDMDGTLLDSTPGVLATWDFFAREYNLDLSQVLKSGFQACAELSSAAHGVRTIDNLRNWCKITDEALLQDAVLQFESMIVSEARRLQSEGKTGLQILPGVADMLDVLRTSETPLWAIVTSATYAYASAALPTAGIPAPPKLITADDVTKGKPNPDPYLIGAERINVKATDCIVVEDAPSGIKSGVAAGSRVLAVCTSHPREEVEGCGATWIVTDLTKVKTSVVDGKVQLEIDESP